MTVLADHSRSLVAYTIWADTRILDAVSNVSLAESAPLCGQFAHMTGTIRWWHARWTGGVYDEPRVTSFDEARAALTAGHADLRAFTADLDDAGWHRSEQWWKEWGHEARAPIGEMLTQVVLHGVQHRSELAVQISALGHSPGDLDYIFYLRGPM